VFFVYKDDKIVTEEKEYDVSATAIKDKSLLSTHAQKLCENIDAYWMTPACTAVDSNEGISLHIVSVLYLSNISLRERACGHFKCLY